MTKVMGYRFNRTFETFIILLVSDYVAISVIAIQGVSNGKKKCFASNFVHLTIFSSK